MKKRSFTILFLVFSLMFTFSCTENLELTPKSLITVESFWTTEDDARGGLYAMYNQFRIFAAYDLNTYGGLRSGSYEEGIGNPGELLKYMENNLNALTADLDWQQPYRIVNYANLIINKVPAIEIPEESVKNDIIAQAYTIRAYMYFTMAKTWGDLPLVTEPIEGFDAETTFKARTPVNQIFEFIKSDIDQALALFPDNELPNRRSTWSKAAANTLKGDVYLWTGKTMGGGAADITIALNALEEAESANLALLDNFSDIFDYNNKGNQEIIFAVHFEELEDVNENYFSKMWVPSLPEGVDEQTKEIIGITGGRSRSTQPPSALIRNQFNDDDQRKDVTFMEIFTYDENGVPSYLTAVTFKGEGVVIGGTRYFADDVIIYRYADLLLMIAEAKNALGQDPSEEINQVRQRAYGDSFSEHEFVSGSQEENDEAILQERLFELAFESKRWWDLIRFGKAFELVPSLQGRENEQHLLLFPITLETISLNSKIQQNPGY